MSVALPSWATRDGVPPLPPLDEGLTQRLLEAAARRELSAEELDAVRSVCARVDDPSEFLHTLIDRWQFKGAGESFMQRLFSWLATERDVLWLGDLARRQKPWTDHVWARIAPRRRALDLLAAVDTPLGWLEILRFRDATRVDDLYRAARDLVVERARRAGLHLGEEDDLAAPGLGFVHGVRSFDEARGLQIDARDRDHVHLVRADGRTFAHVPPARKRDDAEAVARSREDWSLLRPAIFEVLDRGADRLERAMVTQRRWSDDVWRSQWLVHPLLGAYARRVVWRAHTDVGAFTFLISEEREALRADGSAVALDDARAFEVAHPTSLEPTWQGMLADLEIVQPFEQLHRRGRAHDGKLNPDVLIAAERWGWERRALRTGSLRYVLTLVSGDFTARVTLSPGIETTDSGRPKPRQSPQEVIGVEIENPEREKLQRPDWPELLRLEVDVLLARAAL